MTAAKKDLRVILAGLLHAQGGKMLVEVIRERAGTTAKLPNFRPPAKKTEWLPFLAGFLLALPLPKRDVTFTRHGKPQDAITLHFASLLTLEVGMEWVRRLLQKAALTPGLTPNQMRVFQRAERFLDMISSGIAPGIAAGDRGRALITKILRRSGAHLHIPLHDSVYRVIERWFSDLSRKRP